MKLYRHYKNKLYKYIGIAKHSDTLEDFVVYECLYDNPMAHLWVRPKNNFFEKIEVDGKLISRFTEISSVEKRTGEMMTQNLMVSEDKKISDNNQSLKLEVLTENLSIVRMNSLDLIPTWALQSSFFSISKTLDELSIVCRDVDVPGGFKCERNWRAVKVKGPLDFGLTGVLASLVAPLARAEISIFAISTFDTDYILVKNDKLEEALKVLMTEDYISFGR